MSRLPAWVLPLLAGVLATALAVTAGLAADQPAAAKPQMVRFVAHFITFTPKDPSILGDGSKGLKACPRWEAEYLQRRNLQAKTPRGYPLAQALPDLLPKVGPLDALKGRDPKAVAELMTRLDGRWRYHVATLCASGRVGGMLAACGWAGPIPIRTPQGAEVGQQDSDRFDLTCVVRVDRLLGAGRALAQTVAVVDRPGRESGSMFPAGGRLEEIELGAPTEPFGQGANARNPYTSVAGVRYARVVRPGLVCLETIEQGAWGSSKPYLYYPVPRR